MASVKIKKKFMIADEIWIKAKPAKVFAALTNEKELTKWWPQVATVDPQKGGQIFLEFEEGSLSSVFTDFRKNKEIGMEFFDAYLTFKLSAQTGGTSVSVEHTCAANTALEDYVHVAQSWSSLLCNLRAWLEKKWDMRP